MSLYNDIYKINHILRDRLTIIQLDGFKIDDKKKIVKNYLLLLYALFAIILNS